MIFIKVGVFDLFAGRVNLKLLNLLNVLALHLEEHEVSLRQRRMLIRRLRRLYFAFLQHA